MFLLSFLFCFGVFFVSFFPLFLMHNRATHAREIRFHKASFTQLTILGCAIEGTAPAIDSLPVTIHSADSSGLISYIKTNNHIKKLYQISMPSDMHYINVF